MTLAPNAANLLASMAAEVGGRERLAPWIDHLIKAKSEYARVRAKGNDWPYRMSSDRAGRAEKLRKLLLEAELIIQEDREFFSCIEDDAPFFFRDGAESSLTDLAGAIDQFIIEHPIYCGAKPNIPRQRLFTFLAYIYHQASGNEPATSKSTEDDGAIGGPFVRFVVAAHRLLLPEEAPPSGNIIDDFVDWHRAKGADNPHFIGAIIGPMTKGA